ncbi:hypothetical protein [Campylobacter jejuni]|uniref:hypothetical protein n=1 Tax=Campylobacter jejuni TaxID=197 RepID=UPI002043C42F|nr:hypothetical protein [Campylobacter jejuni]
MDFMQELLLAISKNFGLDLMKNFLNVVLLALIVLVKIIALKQQILKLLRLILLAILKTKNQGLGKIPILQILL